MPLRSDVRKLGRQWPTVVERAARFAKSIPPGGVSLAVFERAALLDVDPTSVRGVAEALHTEGVVWLRRNRGEVRVFSKRPSAIRGTFDTTSPMDRFLASSVVHVRRVCAGLRARDAAKARGDAVAAQEARERVGVSIARSIAVARSHAARGLPLSDLRRELWALFPASAIEAVAAVEPALSRTAVEDSFEAVEKPRRRLAAGLTLEGKVAGLVERAGSGGITKTGLYQSIRPKVSAEGLANVLDGLAAAGRIEARQVGARGSGSGATRFFTASSPVAS